ncbi:MAG: NADH-quinone oxidoreductase subunit NuoK [Phycisphaerae bacterium]|nr:NADH-quinone oxidoreductase subunit NuoK [Phycisphaerae bacterium]NUQ45175.1 NADH-quinone oxidoreductase subunit NuoK [Phycisphaerae bacterium]
MTIGLTHYLILSAAMFACGVMCMMLKRNAVGVLVGIELLLNAANVNFVAFARYRTGAMDGQIAAVFVILLAAAEAAIAIAIFMNFYNNAATIDVDRGATLRG